MTILDTNVVSEIMKPKAAPAVDGWLAIQDPETLLITSITKAEILYGLEIMPQGKRRDWLAQAAQEVFDTFPGRILPFDSQAAVLYAEIVARRRQSGRPIGQSDAQIAAIARCRGFALSTRNTEDFAGCGVKLINPWEG